jgi:hypothetical protein
VRPQEEIPNFLSHYYEGSRTPFLSLTALPAEEAERILDALRKEGSCFASWRSQDYLSIRCGLEQRVRSLFVVKGGKPRRETPHYMILGECRWLLDWYVDGRELRIPLSQFDLEAVSFTYGDTFPAMRYQDGRPYRGQVYTWPELRKVVRCYGLPQTWNAEGKLGPERYIEAQVWDDEPIVRYLGC